MRFSVSRSPLKSSDVHVVSAWMGYQVVARYVGQWGAIRTIVNYRKERYRSGDRTSNLPLDWSFATQKITNSKTFRGMTSYFGCAV